MALSWNEIKSRAVEFSGEWADTSNEDADAKPFLVEFFNVFGISRKKVGSFEHRVKKLDEHDGYIDLLWKGTILIEMKSRGKSLDKAFVQAKDYLHGLKQHELPQFILVSDFEIFRLHDLVENTTVEFKLSELVQNVQHFAYLLGYQKNIYKEQDPANIKAAELMGKLHDRLEEIGYTGHVLEVYLVRLLFCLFAEDTTIFNKQQFQDLIEQRTGEDGSDLARMLQELFQQLNTPKDERFTNLDEQLADFPYVNGKLFEEILPTTHFDSKMRQDLLDCCYLDWSRISPAIFGSMFQSVMNPQERRNLGAHYTSETNILKLIKPLFLDDLWKEFESIKDNRNKLQEFHQRLSKLKFLDPACGCGNFLVITYRELRLLEIEILRALNKTGQAVLDVRDIIWLDVDMMYGIEFEEFPARIAEVAMWLIDHQMNMLISNEFGQYFVRLPLKKSATIVHGNALQIDWETVVSKDELSYILGNPPFIGKQYRSDEQNADMEYCCSDVPNFKILDYVCAWYIKAVKFLSGEASPLDVRKSYAFPAGSTLASGGSAAERRHSLEKGEENAGEAELRTSSGQAAEVRIAFVSTNSITQGEQVGVLWQYLLDRGVKLHFAHRTFQWNNEARGKAAVFCVIIGFGLDDIKNKRLFDYETPQAESHELIAKNINPYLIDAPDRVIRSRTTSICDVPPIVFGSMANDGGFLFLSDEEKRELIVREPAADKFIRRVYGSEEFINKKTRWCLWLKESTPTELRSMPEVMRRIEQVRQYRQASKREATRKLAAFPFLFGEIRQPDSDYILIPKVSSERRNYIPIGIMSKDIIATDLCLLVPNSTLFHFGVLTSVMHNAWMRQVCGRLKSDYRYSNSLVYNNFPWPENPSEKQITAIETAAQRVLDARGEFPNSSLADLYDPLTMPPVLVKAHNDLDKAVDLAYRPQPFASEAGRMVFLFELYEKYTAGLFTEPKKKKRK